MRVIDRLHGLARVAKLELELSVRVRRCDGICDGAPHERDLGVDVGNVLERRAQLFDAVERGLTRQLVRFHVDAHEDGASLFNVADSDGPSELFQRRGVHGHGREESIVTSVGA
jgi:hypothetical protein